MSGFVTLFVAAAAPGGFFGPLPFSGRLLATGLALVLFMVWALFFMPRVWRLSMDSGWPVYPLQVAVFMPPVAVCCMGSAMLESALDDPARLLTLFVVGMAVTALSAACGLLMLQTFVLPKIPGLPAPEQLWTFRNRRGADETRSRLPGEPILRMDADNQYVRVETSTGADLVRMSLTEAVAALPDGLGMRVHRSHWLAFDQMAGLRFENGNPRVVTRSGARVPVSRQKLPALRAELERRDTP